MENEPSLRSTPYSQQYFDLRWIHSTVRCLEGAVRSSTGPYARDDGSVRLCTTPTICRLHSHHARVSVSVAYVHHPDYVSDPGDDVCEARAPGRARGACGVWRNLPPIYDCDAGLFPTSGKYCQNATRITRSLIDYTNLHSCYWQLDRMTV